MMLIFTVSLSYGNIELLWLIDVIYFPNSYVSLIAPVILTAYKKLHKMLCRAALRPKLQRLDIECSDLLKEYMRDEHIDFQLAPPGVHRRNVPTKEPSVLSRTILYLPYAQSTRIFHCIYGTN
jgi:hypothetical protein